MGNYSDTDKLILLIKELIKDKLQAVKRPGTYYGMHLIDYGDQISWGNAEDGKPCGANVWFAIDKKKGDTYKVDGTCEMGLDKFQIILVG